MPSRRHSSANQGVRRIYEAWPYPSARSSVVTRPEWRLPPWEWIRALWKPEETEFYPRRILVAGCGTGSEAFALKRRFPRAEVVAVDFSPRSIAIARELQQRVKAMRSIRFEVADLTRLTLRRKVGREAFDFITCHGVLSYTAEPEKTLANLTGCLSRAGALYLGVNGSQHASAIGRTFLQALGVDVSEYREDRDVRQALEFFDTIAGDRIQSPLACRTPCYLAVDFFGPMIRNLPLSDWTAMAAAAGLHVQGSLWGYHILRRAAEHPDFARLLIPRSRGDVCALLEAIHPAPFHHLLLTASPTEEADWENDRELINCRAVWTGLYQCQLPKPSASRGAKRAVTLKSPAMNTQLGWELPEWMIETLRRLRGGTHQSAILSERLPAASLGLAGEFLYTLHQLGVVSVLRRTRPNL